MTSTAAPVEMGGKEGACTSAVSNSLDRSAKAIMNALNTSLFCFETEEFGIDFSVPHQDSDEQRKSPEDTGVSFTGQKSFSAVRFIQSKLSYGAALQTIQDDLKSFSIQLGAEIQSYAADAVAPSLDGIAARSTDFKKELLGIQSPLGEVVSDLGNHYHHLERTLNEIRSKMESVARAQNEQQFHTSCAKSLLLYDTIAEMLSELNETNISESPTAEMQSSSSMDELSSSLSSSFSSSSVEEKSETKTTSDQKASVTRGAPSDSEKVIRKLTGEAKRRIPHSFTGCHRQSWEGRSISDKLYFLRLLVASLVELREAVSDSKEACAEMHEVVGEKEGSRQQSSPALERELAEIEEIQRLCHEVECATFLLLERFMVELSEYYFDDQPGESTEAGSSVVPSNNPKTILSLLQSIGSLYAATGDVDRFKEACEKGVVYPALECIFSWSATTSSRHSTEATLDLLERLQALLEHRIAPLLPVCRQVFPHHEFYPAADVVWPAVCRVLHERLPNLFDALTPEAFRQKYLAATRLETVVVHQLCASEEERQRMLSPAHSATRTWRQKWNADIYVAECIASVSRRMAARVESWQAAWRAFPIPFAVRSTQPAGSTSGAEWYKAVQSETDALWRELVSVAAELFQQVFLFPSLPSSVRYIVKAAYSLADTARYTIEPVVVQAQREGGGDETSEPQREEQRTHVWRAAWEIVESVGGLSVYISDDLLALVNAAVKGSGDTTGTLTTEAVSAIKAAHELGGQSTNAVYRDLLKFLQNVMIEAAILPLQHMHSVRALYSHTQRESPSAPSWYVATSVKPLLRFIDVAISGAHPSPVVYALVTDNHDDKTTFFHDAVALLEEAIESLFQNFCSIAEETLKAAKKAEEGWEKLRRKREAAAGSSVSSMGSPSVESPTGVVANTGGATDRQKMLQQFVLDLNAMSSALQQQAPKCSREKVDQAAKGVLQVLNKSL